MSSKFRSIADNAILIIGAGPAGLAAAIECARRGFQVRIVDMAKEGAKESRAVAVNVKSMRVLEASGVTAKLVARGVHMRGVRFVIDGKQAARVDLTRLPAPYDFVLALPQSETEAILAASLAELGVTVEREVTCSAVTQSDGKVMAELTHLADGHTETYSADWLIAADGAHSTVRHQLGLDFAGAAYPFHWSLADVDMTGDIEADEGEARLTRGQPLVLRFPIAAGRHRLISTAPNVLEILPASWSIGPIHWQSTFSVSHRMVERRLIGRIALIGDAAHIHSPAGGRGMNLGIEDAASFAEALATDTLSTWEAKRLERARSVLKGSDRMQRLVTLSDTVWNRLLLRSVLTAAGLPMIQRCLVYEIAAANE